MLKCLLVAWLHNLKIERQTFLQRTMFIVNTVKHNKVLLETKRYCKPNLCPIWWHVSTYGFQGSQPMSFVSDQSSPRLLCPCFPPIILCSDSIYVCPLLPLILSHLYCPCFACSCYNTALHFYSSQGNSLILQCLSLIAEFCILALSVLAPDNCV